MFILKLQHKRETVKENVMNRKLTVAIIQPTLDPDMAGSLLQFQRPLGRFPGLCNIFMPIQHATSLQQTCGLL